MFLDYTLRIELENGPIDVRIDDRMYRVSDNIVINESKCASLALAWVTSCQRSFVTPKLRPNALASRGAK